MWNLILIGALAYYIYQTSTNLVDKIGFSPAAFRLKDQVLDLNISNPTDTQAKILSVDGKIYAGNSSIGTYNVTEPFTIAPKATTKIRVKINLDKLSALDQILDVIKSGRTPQVSITGRVGTSLASFDFTNTLLPVKNLIAA